MIINVSGVDNNCGLYSLALAVSMALEQRPDETVSVAIPERIRQIKVADVSTVSEQKLQELGFFLREQLAIAMKNDAVFKERQKNSFCNLCIDPLPSMTIRGVPNDLYPHEKEAFIKSNRRFLVETQWKLDALALSLEALIIPEEPVFSEEYIVAFSEQLNEIVSQNSDQQTIDNVLSSQYVQHDHQLYSVCVLFNKAWAKVEARGNQTVKNSVEHWFFQQAEALIARADKEHGNLKQSLLDLGACRVLMEGSADVVYNSRELYARYLVNDQWDNIFDRYVNYVKLYFMQLSADEIGTLAGAWHVGLKTLGPNQPVASSTLPEGITPTISVTLINLSKSHWQVLSALDSDVEEYIPQADTAYSAAKNSGTQYIALQERQLVSGPQQDIIQLKAQLQRIRKQKIGQFDEQREELQRKLAENEAAFLKKQDDITHRKRAQYIALETLQRLDEDIYLLQLQIADQEKKLYAIDRQLPTVSLDQAFENYLRDDFLDALLQQAEPEADHRKALLGMEASDIQLNKAKRHAETLRLHCKGYEDKLKRLNNDLDVTIENAKKASDNKKIADQQIQHYEEAKQAVHDDEEQFNEKLKHWGKIRVSTCGGNVNADQYGYIKVNGQSRRPSGKWRGLLMIFINAHSGVVVSEKIFDTHDSVDKMNKAAYQVEKYCEKYQKGHIIVITSVDESTHGGGEKNSKAYGRLADQISALGSHHFTQVGYRHLWYFIRGEGIEGGQQEYHLPLARDDNNLHHESKEYILHEPRQTLLANHNAEKAKKLITIQGNIDQQKRLSDAEAANKETAERIGEQLKHDIAENTARLQGFKTQLQACERQQEQLIAQRDGHEQPSHIVANVEIAAPEHSSDADRQLLCEQLKQDQLALKEANEKRVEAIIRVNALIGRHEFKSDIPLINAVLHQHVALVKEILSKGLKDECINAKDQYGWTALHCAVARANLINKEDSEEIIRLLLLYGASMDIQDGEERLPHQVALTEEMQRFVLNTALNTYARKGDIHQCHFVLAYEADPNTTVSVALDEADPRENDFINEGRTPLVWALVSRHRNAALIDLLVSYGAEKVEQQFEPVKLRRPSLSGVIYTLFQPRVVDDVVIQNTNDIQVTL